MNKQRWELTSWTLDLIGPVVLLVPLLVVLSVALDLYWMALDWTLSQGAK